MLCSKEINGANFVASNSIGDWSITDCKKIEDEEQSQAIVIVEPRLGAAVSLTTRSSTSSTSSSSSEWSMSHTVDMNNDVMRLVSSLSTVVQILNRMTNAAAEELRQFPEHEERFQGLRMLLSYADQMYTTLLQPHTFPMESTNSQSNATSQSYSLFHHLFATMRSSLDAEEEESLQLSL